MGALPWGGLETPREGGPGLYNTQGRGRKPKPPLGYLRAVLVKMLWGITSYRTMVERLENNPDLNKMCGFNEKQPPSRTGVSRFLRRLSEAERTPPM